MGQQIDHDERIVLFVRLRDGPRPGRRPAQAHSTQIRANTTPRHVPAVIEQVADIPRTRSGKISEIAVRDVVNCRPMKNTKTLANPQALLTFKYPVHFGAQRLGANGKADMDLSRAMIPIIEPGSSAKVTIMLPVEQMLNHSAELLPVQEQVAWFDAWGTKPVVVGPFTKCTGSMAGKICGPDGKPLSTQPAK